MDVAPLPPLADAKGARSSSFTPDRSTCSLPGLWSEMLSEGVAKSLAIRIMKSTTKFLKPWRVSPTKSISQNMDVSQSLSCTF
uniref:Uncharacterized protein n=1 Tax=Anguilla anguilla TaxID=7936 RepID=A0A0E9UJR3_ANGAN